MAVELATAYISLVPSARGMKGKIQSELSGAGVAGAAATESAFGKSAGRVKGLFSTALKSAAIVGAGAFGLAAVAIKETASAASDYEESLSKVGAVFGKDQQAVMQQWAKGSAKAFGQSQKQALEAAGTYGNLFTSFGLTADKSAVMSKSMVELASDLASFNNTSPEDALDALRSGLTGEMEPLKRFGVALDDASLRAEALRQGIYDGTGVLTPAQKAQASYALILERTKNAQGDFARTSGGLANQQRIFAARVDDLKVKIGQALLPAITKMLPVLSSMFDRIGPLVDQAIPALGRAFGAISAWWAKEGPGIMAQAKVVFDGLVEGVGTVVAVVKQYWPQISATVSEVMTTVSDVIKGVVTVVTVLWRNFGDNLLGHLKRIVGPIVLTIKGVMETIRGIIKVVTSLIQGDWSGVWNGIKMIFSGVWKAILGIVRYAVEEIRTKIGMAMEVARSMVSGAMRAIKSSVSDGFNAVVSFIAGLPGRISRVAGGMFDGIKNAFRSALNWVIRSWNRLEFKIPGFDPPGPGPKIGGFTLGVPDIPEFHSGGVVPGRMGSEVLALLQAGETVRTPAQEAALGGAGVVNIYGPVGDDWSAWLARQLRSMDRGGFRVGAR